MVSMAQSEVDMEPLMPMMVAKVPMTTEHVMSLMPVAIMPAIR
jgi:hypothetical protein